MAMFIITAILAALAIIYVCKYYTLRMRIITVKENHPKGNRETSKVLKLSNEIAPYVYEDAEHIYLDIVKPKK